MPFLLPYKHNCESLQSTYGEVFKILEYVMEKIYNIKVLLNNLICVIEVDYYGKK